jgi:RHH-type transcriptional regulator, rel operon repressor / antitoxin RelB
MVTSIRLDPAIEKRLDHLAAQTGRTKAYYLRELVQNGLEDLEDFYLAAQTAKSAC